MSNIILKDETINRIVFHFNKGFLQDPTIPMWTIKHKGNSYYINHLESKIGFSTKETPDNFATKGSLMFKGKLTILSEENQITAYIN